MMNLRFASQITRETLGETFGFPVPAAFAEAVMLASREARSIGQDVVYFFEDACGFYLDADGARYQQTPAELFPVGTMGVDGVHYGYVHAPELCTDDYPMGTVCPMDSSGVVFLGRNTAEGFENLISSVLLYAEGDAEEPLDAETRRRIGLLSQVLEIAPHPEKAHRQYDSNGNGLPIEPQVPEGWLHLATADGVGVLAPASCFESSSGPRIDHYHHTPPAWYLEQAEKALAAGFPATALLHLRERYWHHWPAEGVMEPFLAALRRAYASLNRPLLADVAEASARKWGQLYKWPHR